ncbi:MAG: hypothetical protein OXD39_15160 [Gemmatimonadetes bacterium]|nr:hypothetical protein [Gemmatimonadota bacterium]
MARRSQSEPGSTRSYGRRRTTGSQKYVPPFRGSHFRLFAVVLGVILLGFVVLAYESITLAPLLMVSGYCVGIPIILIWRGRFPWAGSANDRGSRRP